MQSNILHNKVSEGGTFLKRFVVCFDKKVLDDKNKLFNIFISATCYARVWHCHSARFRQKCCDNKSNFEAKFNFQIKLCDKRHNRLVVQKTAKVKTTVMHFQSRISPNLGGRTGSTLLNYQRGLEMHWNQLIGELPPLRLIETFSTLEHLKIRCVNNILCSSNIFLAYNMSPLFPFVSSWLHPLPLIEMFSTLKHLQEIKYW